MILSWLKRRRRRRLTAAPFPPAWLAYLDRRVAHYALLTDAEQARLRDDLRVFVAEKNWEGCGGLVVTDEIRVTVAAWACLLLLGMEHDYYPAVRSVLMYPEGFQAPYRRNHGPFLEEEGVLGELGEASYLGAVVLSWADVLRGGHGAEHCFNLVIHEFAHQLDFGNGLIDGTPRLRDRDQERHWRRVMTEEYRRLCRDADRGRETLLDPYGTEDEGEFFAVASECFFERPVEMARRHPALYDLLRGYYRQDTARRFAGKP